MLTGKKVRIFNALPSVSQEEVAERAGLEGLPGKSSPDIPAFKVACLYDIGGNKQSIVLVPYEEPERWGKTEDTNSYLVDEKPAKELLAAEQHNGFTIVEEGADPTPAIMATLEHARRHYYEMGSQSLRDARVRMSDAEWEVRKFDYSGQLLNDAKVEIIQEKIRDMRSSPKKKEKAGGKNETQLAVS